MMVTAIVVLIIKAQDAYGTKLEIVYELILWLVVVVMMVLDTEKASLLNMRSYIYLVPVVAFFGTLFVSSVVPLFHAFLFDKEFARSPGDFSQFLGLLDSFEFRNAFYEFLTTQFSQENLQFYEATLLWKALAPNDPDRETKAGFIIDMFISENGLCQINISDDTRKSIKNEISKTTSPTIFDGAIDTVVQNMYHDSFVKFWLVWSKNISGTAYLIS